MVEKHKYKNKPVKNALLTYLNETNLSKISPKGLGFVHRKKEAEINLSSFYLGDSHIDAFSKGINLSNEVDTLNLSRTKLSSNKVIKIIL